MHNVSLDSVEHAPGYTIDCSDRLENAVVNSRLLDNLVIRPRRIRFDRLSHVTRDLRNVNLRELVPRANLVSGVERDSGEALTIGFYGALRVLDFCAGHIFASETFERTSVSSAVAASADILVSDHVLASPLKRSRAGIRVPPWVRQQMPIAADWSSNLARLPASLRQELRRHLRRQRFRVGLSIGQDAIRSYFRDLHVPYLTDRFRDNAILVSEAAFVDQCRNMTRLDLIHEEAIVAASLLELCGSRLIIRASSMVQSAAATQGRADTLDYFALLIGQLLGCDCLDFGLSRPHLDNGSFRYKSKWCTQLSPAGGFKADICLSLIHI